MKKYVYQLNIYINKHKLLREIYPLLEEENSIHQMFQKTASYLNINEDIVKNSKLSIQVMNQKKNIENYLKSLNFNDLDEEYKRKKFISKLNMLGIKEKNVDLNELRNLVNLILENNNIINRLNTLHTFSYEDIESILIEYQITSSESVLKNFTDLLNQLSLYNLTEKLCNFRPMKRSKYYDENNNIILKVEMEADSNLFSTLTDFKGEIYESLNFKSNEEAKLYQEENNIEEDLLEDVVSAIHFHAESTVNDWYNELSIIKYRVGCIYINYGERLFIQNKKNNTSITSEEIEAIIEEFEYRGINNEFIKYVVNELSQFKKTLSGKDNRKNLEMLSDNEQEKLELLDIVNKRNNSLTEISRILRDKDYGNDKTIYVKIKVISDVPITFQKNNTMILK